MAILPSYISAMTLTSALGRGNEATTQALRGGHGGLEHFPLSPSGSTWFGSVTESADIAFSPALSLYNNAYTRLIIAALSQDNFMTHVQEAKERFGKERIALFLGTITGASCELEDIYKKEANAKAYPQKMPLEFHGSINSGVEFTRKYLDITGPFATISTACSSSAKVFATAHRYLQAGLCDAAIVAGVEARCEILIYGFRALSVLSSDICRPWDMNRNGINIGAAAGFALLQREPKNPNDFTLRGYGETSDGYHMTAPDPEGKGVENAMRIALASAGLSPGDIDYINAHGSATPMNDITEDGAITRVFGEGALVSSTKGFTGHTQGAAGITEAIITMLSMKASSVPKSLNTQSIDPQMRCHIPLENVKKTIRFALSNSMGFGGNNATLIFGAPQ